MIKENDHVGWLREQADRFQATGELVEDERKKRARVALAERLRGTAEALEAALAAGNEGESGKGARAVADALKPGTRVKVALAAGGAGPIVLLGRTSWRDRYNFMFELGDGRRFVVPKHSVVYWELVGGGGR